MADLLTRRAETWGSRSRTAPARGMLGAGCRGWAGARPALGEVEPWLPAPKG